MKEPPVGPRLVTPSFTARLFSGSDPTASALSAVESRVLAIARSMLIDCVIACRIENAPTMAPLTPLLFARAAEMAIMGAIAVEKPLRDLRDKLEAPTAPAPVG